MMRILLLYFAGCPNADAARDVLRKNLLACGLPPDFEEIDLGSETAPEELRRWGSPTILLDGKDISGESDFAGPGCRLYPTSDRETRGIPSDSMIRAALMEARQPRSHWMHSFAVAPAGLLALLPSAACPACIPAYLGFLSVIGLGFLFDESVQPWILTALVLLALASMAWTARAHGSLGPLALSFAGSVALFAARLVPVLSSIDYAGILLLFGAAGWNLWLKRPKAASLVRLTVKEKRS